MRFILVYAWLVESGGIKIKLQKDFKEFQEVSIFTQVAKNWQDI